MCKPESLGSKGSQLTGTVRICRPRTYYTLKCRSQYTTPQWFSLIPDLHRQNPYLHYNARSEITTEIWVRYSQMSLVNTSHGTLPTCDLAQGVLHALVEFPLEVYTPNWLKGSIIAWVLFWLLGRCFPWIHKFASARRMHRKADRVIAYLPLAQRDLETKTHTQI